MKKIFLMLIALMTINSVSYASFPVTETVETNILVDNEKSIWQKLISPNEKTLGLLLGFFLGIIGVVIAYAMDDDEIIKYAWRGFLFGMLLVLVIFILMISVLGAGVAAASSI